MLPGADPVAPPSLTARRPAANNLGPFELPPPPTSLVNKYQPFAALNGSGGPSSGSVTSVGNLLTPPNTVPSENLSPVSTGMQSGALSTNHDTSSPSHHISPGQSVSPFASPSFWMQSAQSSSQSQYPFSSGSTPQWMPPRNLFSPTSLNSMMRSNTASNSADGLPHPSYDMHQLPPFSNSLSMSAPSSLPGMHTGQSALLHGQQLPLSAPQTSPIPQHEAFSRPLPTPTFYGHSATSSSSSQHGQYPSGSGPSPTMAASSQPPHRSSLPTSGSDMSMAGSSHHQNQYQRSFGQYQLPAMNGPVMSNLHSPSSQMSLVNGMPNMMGGGFNSGHAIQHMYGMPHHGQQQQQPQERPFKCDQCIQSFNRNHDLKRHKRIHLAVKPFPCGHCDKSFSRKDALKRHILVKSCGKAATTDLDDDGQHDGSASPTDVNDGASQTSRNDS